MLGHVNLCSTYLGAMLGPCYAKLRPFRVYGAHLVAMLGPVGSMLDICRTYIWHFSEFWELRPFQNREKPHDSRTIKYTSWTNPIDACAKQTLAPSVRADFCFFLFFSRPCVVVLWRFCFAVSYFWPPPSNSRTLYICSWKGAQSHDGHDARSAFMWSGPPSLASIYSKQIGIANAEFPSICTSNMTLKKHCLVARCGGKHKREPITLHPNHHDNDNLIM